MGETVLTDDTDCTRRGGPTANARNAALRPPAPRAAFAVIAGDGAVPIGAPSWPELDHATLVGGRDLRDVSMAAASAIEAENGESGHRVLVLIDALLREDPRDALVGWQPIRGPAQGRAPLRYCGSPRGLASLVVDLYLLGMADGVVIVPDGDDSARLLARATTPMLARSGFAVRKSPLASIA